MLSRRTPHGVRGLKLLQRGGGRFVRGSHPSRGAWIEIIVAGEAKKTAPRRTPHGVRGLKCYTDGHTDEIMVSHPSRGAWIEIMGLGDLYKSGDVAPLTGCVD